VNRTFRLHHLWSWLPAFRAVAETQHLPSAARELHVTPSALSRSIRLLEDAIGQSLFTREERRIKLNRHGEILLSVVREAMRHIDDGIVQVSATEVERVRVAGPAIWLRLILMPVMHELRNAGANLVIDMVDLGDEQIAAALLRGDIDLALNERHTAGEELIVEMVGEVRRSVCGGQHGDALPFALYLDGSDPWPPEIPREVGLRSPYLDIVIDECASGRMQSVLPEVVARAFGLAMDSTRVLSVSRLYLSRRRPLRVTPLNGLIEGLSMRARTLLDADPVERSGLPAVRAAAVEYSGGAGESSHQ
jgi:DNA-binding transcriptional LysR family regulator